MRLIEVAAVLLVCLLGAPAIYGAPDICSEPCVFGDGLNRACTTDCPPCRSRAQNTVQCYAPRPDSPDCSNLFGPNTSGTDCSGVASSSPTTASSATSTTRSPTSQSSGNSSPTTKSPSGNAQTTDSTENSKNFFSTGGGIAVIVGLVLLVVALIVIALFMSRRRSSRHSDADFMEDYTPVAKPLNAVAVPIENPQSFAMNVGAGGSAPKVYNTTTKAHQQRSYNPDLNAGTDDYGASGMTLQQRIDQLRMRTDDDVPAVGHSGYAGKEMAPQRKNQIEMRGESEVNIDSMRPTQEHFRSRLESTESMEL